MTCIFCAIVEGKLPSYKVYENHKVLAFLDLNPSAKGHTLIIPKAHEARIENLTQKDAEALFITIYKLISPIQRAMGAPACTIGVNNGKEAGQEIPHIHVHIIPRKLGDRGSIIQALAKTPNPSIREYEEITELIRNEIRKS
jgi:histidine triad (HIT) family protein